MGIVVSMLSRRGGAGKTSLSVHLAGYWASEGLSVRLVDFDNQCSLSQTFLGSEVVRNLRPEESVEACIKGESPEKIERPTSIDNVTILPAHLGLTSGFLDTPNLAGPDVVIIDTPPNLKAPVVHVALMTSDVVVAPVDPETYGCQAIISVQDAVGSVALGENMRINLLGFPINRRQRLKSHAAIEETLRRIHGGMILDTVIPELVAFKEAIEARKPVTEYEPNGKAAKKLIELSDELWSRMKTACERRRAA